MKVLKFENNCRYDDDADCVDQFLFLSPGKYFLEVWGASGGYNSRENVAKGGYSSGFLSLSERTKVYVYVGAQGEQIVGNGINSSKPFNGGGSCWSGRADTSVCSSGGGSSDIRIGSTSIKKRVIVAGAGGGGAFSQSCNSSTPGGAGGGIVGIDGDSVCDGKGGRGGGTYNQSFFYGGSAIYADGCGGGGGFFGGEPGYSYLNGGGGGSGFAFSKETYDYAIESGITLDTKYFLRNTTVSSGLEFIPNPANMQMIKGNFGDGFARITFIHENTGNNIANKKFIQLSTALIIHIFILNKI